MKAIDTIITNDLLVDAVSVKELIESRFNKITKYIILTDNHKVPKDTKALLRNLSTNTVVQIKTYKEQLGIATEYNDQFIKD